MAIMRDSMGGLGSLPQGGARMAAADEEPTMPTEDMLLEPGAFQSDEKQMIQEILQSGKLAQMKSALDPEQLSSIRSMYDEAIANRSFNGTFDQFFATLIVQLQKKGRQGLAANEGVASLTSRV
tara:strand:- start:240 stop:611 length:372 start_codon:yes stop_codon:yes gene_type:complete